jgi:outer membrane protein OmpA-like peptidoglycan-associated protein
MRKEQVLLMCSVIVIAGAGAIATPGCHAEANFGQAQPPPAPPPAPTVAETPPAPPPPAAPKRVIALKGVQMKSSTQIDMPGDIEFQKASSKIVMNDKTKKVLSQLAVIMKDNPEITRLSIEGNTDNEGETKGFDNLKLSQQRAQAVIDWLEKQGVDAKRLSAVGNGSKNPLSANDTPEHMALNRRVEFHVREFNGQGTSADEKPGAAPSTGSLAAATPTPAVPPGPPPPPAGVASQPAAASAGMNGPAGAPAMTPPGSGGDAAKKPAKAETK